MELHAMTENEVLLTLSTDPEKGLTGAEAEKRLKSIGKNALSDE